MQQPANAAADRVLAGIGCLCIGLMFFAVQDAMVKGLVERYSVLQILMMRSLTAVPLLVAFLAWRHGAGGFRSAHPRLQALRSLLVLCAFVSYYVAVSRIPLVDVVALFNAAPLFITALAGPVLGERVGARRWSAVAVGFVGVLIMLRPGSEVFEPVALLGLVAASAYSGSALIARRMGAGESSALIALFSNATFLIACGLGLAVVTALHTPGAATGAPSPLLAPYVGPDGRDLTWMLMLGLVTLTGFVLVPRAYQLAPASVVSPFEYTYLLWALLIGVIFFDEYPSFSTLLGASLVVSAGIYIARREATQARRRAASLRTS